MKPELVYCGWCPLILPNDWVEIGAHFATVHNAPGTQSIRYPQKPMEWSMAALIDGGDA